MAELLEQKQRSMKERQQQPAPQSPPQSPAFERHFSVGEVAAMWNLSPDVVRELFQREPGVLVIGDKSNPKRRRYLTLRIPGTVIERVHRRLGNVAA